MTKKVEKDLVGSGLNRLGLSSKEQRFQENFSRDLILTLKIDLENPKNHKNVTFLETMGSKLLPKCK